MILETQSELLGRPVDTTTTNSNRKINLPTNVEWGWNIVGCGVHLSNNYAWNNFELQEVKKKKKNSERHKNVT